MKQISAYVRRPFLISVVLVVFALTNFAQSGRSWMNGFIFADSDTKGLPGATVELTGDQSNARLKSVHLSTKAENDGKYSLKDIPYGNYTFRVSADGYEAYEIKLYVDSDTCQVETEGIAQRPGNSWSSVRSHQRRGPWDRMCAAIADYDDLNH